MSNPVPWAASPRECRCEEQKQFLADKLDPVRVGVHLLVWILAAAREEQSSSTNRRRSMQQPWLGTSVWRKDFRFSCALILSAK
jgi:hypothetical protein